MKDLRKQAQVQQGQLRPGLVESIRTGLAVPVLSDALFFDQVFPGHPSLPQEYASYAEYTLDDRENLPRIARFYKLRRQQEEKLAGRDFTDNDLRADFGAFVKNFIYAYAEQHGASADMLAEAENQFDRTSVTGFARALAYPRFDRGSREPLLVLADLPFRVLLTTSPYTFLEAALMTAGKQPRTTVIRWRKELRELIPSRDDEAEAPDAAHPLVCHLFGLETFSRSLVLTEDDYLDFVVDVSTSRGDDARDSVPAQVRKALSGDLLVLGFSLASWDFRALYAGLIKSEDSRAEKRGVCLQVAPNEAERGYLDDYLQREARFDVFWGGIEEYTAGLPRL